MSTWKIGQKLFHAEYGMSTFVPAPGQDAVDYQRTCESYGWTAVPEPASVERTLVSGWTRITGAMLYTCMDARCPFESETAVYRHDLDNWACEEHAEEMGVFAPKVDPPAAAKCDHTKSAKCVEPGGCAEAREAKKELAKPVPVVEAPMAMVCSWVGCGSTEAVDLRILAMGERPAPFCVQCYLKNEVAAYELTIKVDDARPPRPGRPPGLVPTSFGDERIGGVWASRGMRIAAGSLPPRPSCPMHPNGGCDGTTGCTRPR